MLIVFFSDKQRAEFKRFFVASWWLMHVRRITMTRARKTMMNKSMLMRPMEYCEDVKNYWNRLIDIKFYWPSLSQCEWLWISSNDYDFGRHRDYRIHKRWSCSNYLWRWRQFGSRTIIYEHLWMFIYCYELIGAMERIQLLWFCTYNDCMILQLISEDKH